MKTVEVNYRKTIKFVLLRIHQERFTGLRLGDRNGKLILDLTLADDGEWIGKEIPSSEDVIGLQVNRTGPYTVGL